MQAARPVLSRNAAIVGSVVLFHLAAIWMLQSGLARRVAEIVIPAEMLSEMITPEAPAQVQPPAPVPVRPETVQRVEPKPVAPKTPAQAPMAVSDPSPATRDAWVVPSAPAAPSAPATPPPSVASPTPAAPVKVELPSSDADYLQNPKPPYPAISKRMGEQGTVLVRVLVGADGSPQKVELARSSGFDRLDQAALTAAARWRFVPGKRGGVPETMWNNVPIVFELESR